MKENLRRDQYWDVWVDWYENILDGGSRNRTEDLAFIGYVNGTFQQIWNDGHASANEWISTKLQSGQLRTDCNDFFISYSSVDEATAREIVGVLEEAGHKAFAQFKDIRPGMSFPREMRDGLAASGRVIALLSPDYEKSDHCQAEWNAAYNVDPSGKSRKIIPFLVRETELSELARPFVYVKLYGLSKARRKQAILAAIADLRLPQQSPVGSQFGRDPKGRIDTLPDPPAGDTAQGDTYDAMRWLAEDFDDLGANLLGSLTKTARRLTECLPHDQARASSHKIFFVGNSLRISLAAHKAVAARPKDPKEPEAYSDPAELPPAVAAKLEAFVAAFNAFVTIDPTAQKLDEQEATPDERAPTREALADIAPAVEDAPDTVVTEQARETLGEQIEAGRSAPETELGDKDRAVAKKSALNFVLETLRSGAGVIVKGAGGAVGKNMIDNWADVVDFVRRYADEITSFAKKVVTDPEELQRILDRIKEMLSP